MGTHPDSFSLKTYKTDRMTIQISLEFSQDIYFFKPCNI